jgi:plastocyanin
MTRFRIAFFAAAALSAVLVWALPAGAQSARPHVTTVNVTAGSPSEFKFKLSKVKVPKGIVTFKVKNAGSVPHDFKIAGRKTKLLNPQQTATLRVTFRKAGKYPYLCTVPSHAVLGMKGTLVVA